MTLSPTLAFYLECEHFHLLVTPESQEELTLFDVTFTSAIEFANAICLSSGRMNQHQHSNVCEYVNPVFVVNLSAGHGTAFIIPVIVRFQLNSDPVTPWGAL